MPPAALGLALMLAATFAFGQAPPPPVPGAPAVRPALRTNRAVGLPNVTPRTNPAPAVPGKAAAKGATNAPTALKASTGTNAPAGSHFLDTLKTMASGNLVYFAVGAALVILIVGLILVQLKSKKAGATGVTTTSSRPRGMVGKKRTAAVQTCNVLDVDNQAKRVWHFDARGGAFRLNREHTSMPADSLPAGLVAKDWRTLFQRKLNIAWLAPENVFLRVVHLPRADYDETVSMVELQLEKLSPIPVAQAVWSFHTMAHAQENMQTVVVMVVAREIVEEFLGKLESEGFQADRLELSMLDQLQATAITEDGAWVYPNAGGPNIGLVAWWYGGVLQNLDLVTMPATNRGAGLREQLTQMAWAGEMEGWLSAQPSWHLVADVGAKEWEPALREGLDQPIDLINPLPDAQLAALTARRAAQPDNRSTLLPPEYAARYQQQFFDRLWMRGLGAIVGLYLVVIAIYLGALAVASYRTTAVEQQVAGLGTEYTNTIRLEARYQVLKDRQELKFAALDGWAKTAQYIPTGFTIDSYNFTDGKRLSLGGSAPADEIQQLYRFEADMRKAQVNEQPLFKAEGGDSATFRASGPTASWGYSLELKRTEVQ